MGSTQPNWEGLPLYSISSKSVVDCELITKIIFSSVMTSPFCVSAGGWKHPPHACAGLAVAAIERTPRPRAVRRRW